MNLIAIAQMSANVSTLCLVNSSRQRYYLAYSQMSLMMENQGDLVWIQRRDRDQDIAAEVDQGDVLGSLTIGDDVLVIELYVGPDDSDIELDPRTGQPSNIAQEYAFPLKTDDFMTLFAALELAIKQRDQFDELFAKVEFQSSIDRCDDNEERLFEEAMMSGHSAITT